MHGLQTVSNIGQRTAHDDAHGVVEVRLPHLVFEVHRQDFARYFVHVWRGQKKVRNTIITTLRNACFDARFSSSAAIIPPLMESTNSPHSSNNSDAAEIAKFDAAAHRFWDVDGEFKPLHKLNPVRSRYVEERATLRGARVLDVGCGGGLLAESLARAGAQVTAIDLASSMIDTARMHALDSGLQIDYRVDDAERLLNTQAGKYDVVTCMEMLEHVPDPAASMTVLGKLVRPGGDLFVSTINRNFRSFLLAIVGAE